MTINTLHQPEITAYRCWQCGHVDPAQPVEIVAPDSTASSGCSECGDDSAEPDAVVCAADRTTWPCRHVEQHHSYAAVEAWANGDYGFQAAAAIVLDSTIAESLIPKYLDWSQYELVARIDFAAAIAALDAGELYLSGSGVVLLHLAANIAHGVEGVDLRGLWSLDPSNRRAVVSALAANLNVDLTATATTETWVTPGTFR